MQKDILNQDLEREYMKDIAYIRHEKETKDWEQWIEEQESRKAATIIVKFNEQVIMDHDRIVVNTLPF